MHHLRKNEQERGAVEMPFVHVRAPNAVQYRDVCTRVTGAIATSYSVLLFDRSVGWRWDVVRTEGGCVSLPVPFVSSGRRPSARGERIMPHDVNLGGEPRSHLRSGAGSVGRSSARLHGRPVG